MASLRAIRTRIKSVRNTQKITKAMKLVAAAKLRRAQDAVLRTRPYAQALSELLGSLARARAAAEVPPHPLMEVRENPRRIEVVLLTSDRGLCGGFNSNIIRRAQRFVVEEEDKPAPGGFIEPEHLYEPSRPALLEHLIPRQLAMQIWRSLLESEAAEHGARMTAMDSATKNANEMIGRLSLQYNRARQASITKELMEIVSGAEAMK